MEPISLIGKVVKVKDVSELMFYYPEFVERKYVTYSDYGDKIIYTGVLNKRAMGYLESCEYIATQGLYQYDLTDRKKKVEFVFSRWGREVPDNIMSGVDLYDDLEFDYCCKTYWIVGRWPYKAESEVSIYELYRSSVEPVVSFVKKYMEITKDYPVGVIEQSFFTFILRAKAVDEQNVSPQYKRLLKSFANVSGAKVRDAMLKFIDSPISDRELKFIEFIYNLRG